MKLIEVQWFDFYEVGGDGWISDEDIKESLSLREDDGVFCKTVGYLISEREKVLIVCQTFQPEEKERAYSNLAVIPKIMIKEIVVLKGE